MWENGADGARLASEEVAGESAVIAAEVSKTAIKYMRRKTDHMQCARQRCHLLWIQLHPLQKQRRHCLTALEKTLKTSDWGICLGFTLLVPRFFITFLFGLKQSFCGYYFGLFRSQNLHLHAVGGSRAAIARGCWGATFRHVRDSLSYVSYVSLVFSLRSYLKLVFSNWRSHL